MSSLANQQQNLSFPGLLQVPGGITSTLQQVQDGNGNATGLSLSSAGASVTTSSTFQASRGGITLTGALPRLISDGFGDILTAKDFGAVGDGVADDTAALQFALNSGNSIRLPYGTYKTSAPLTITTQGACFFGETGAHIKKSGAYDAIVVSASNWSLENLVIDSNAYGGSGIGIKGSNNLVAFCEIYGSSGVPNSHGIYLDGQSTICVYNRITDNWIHNIGGVGISSNTAPDNIRSGNAIYRTGNEGITDDLPSYRSIISNNYINAACQLGGVGGIGIDQASDGTITGNIINSTGNSLPGIKTQNNVGNSNFLTITANTIVNNPGGGIWLSTNGAYTSNNNVVSSNTFQNNTAFDIKIDAGSGANVISGNGVNAVILDASPPGINPKTGIKSSFRAYLSTSVTNATGDGTLVQIPLNATLFNNGSVFDTSTYKFTAPVTGVYQANAGVRLQSGTGALFSQLQIVQAGSISQTAQSEIDLTIASATFNLIVSDLFHMVKGDTLVVKTAASGGTKTYSINGSSTTTYFSAICVG